MTQTTAALGLIVGLLAFLIVEACKIIAQLTSTKEITSRQKLAITMAVAFVSTIAVGFSTGEIDLRPLIDNLKALPEDPAEAITAVFGVLQSFIAILGTIMTTSQGMYLLLVKKMKEQHLLSFANLVQPVPDPEPVAADYEDRNDPHLE